MTENFLPSRNLRNSILDSESFDSFEGAGRGRWWGEQDGGGRERAFPSIYTDWSEWRFGFE